MSDQEQTPAAPVVVNKNKRYRKEKPWDNDPNLDKFTIDDFKPEDNPSGGVVEESSFSVLFP
jgi:ribosomal RNA assembly protein